MSGLTTEQQHELLVVLDFIGRAQLTGSDSAEIMQLLAEKFEAKLTESGIYTRLRCAGITGSSKNRKPDAVLGSWRANATRALDGEQRTAIGHNSRSSANAADDRLRLLIERIERLSEEKKGIADDIRDVFAEAKAVGYDTKVMKQIIRLRAMQPDDRREMEMVLDVYKSAVGLD